MLAIIGENNSGKSNFLKAITLPFLTDDNTHISKKLSWIDINNETKKCYYKKIILNQNKIRNDEITVEQFAEFLPTVSVEVNIQAKVNNWLIDYVDELYEEMEDIKKRKERKELLALIGNRSVLFDFDDFEDDENESYHKNMFESDDIEGGENL